MALRPHILVAIAIAIVALGAASAPAAEAAWSLPQAIVTDSGASNVSGAGNRHGSEAFTWKLTSKRFIRTPGRSGFAGVVRARIRLPDGRLGREQTISGTGALVASPQIGVDESGNVTAVWAQAGRHLSIMAAFRPHGHSFGRAVELGRSQHFADARPALAVGRFGDAVVAWNAGRNVQVVRRSPPLCLPQRARACFSAPLRLRAGADQTVAIGPLGSAYVVWAAEVRSGQDVHTRLRMTVLRRSGRRSGSERFVSSSGDAGQPSLAVARDGTAIIAWRASLPAGGEQNEAAPIMSAASTPDALLSAPQQVSTGRGELPQVRLSPQGEAILAWDEFDPTPCNPDGTQIAVAVRPAGTTAFGAPLRMSLANVAANGASLAIDAAGSAYLAYSADAGAGGRVELTHLRPPGGAFGPAIALPADFAPGGSLLAAGAKITLVSGFGGPTSVSDWAP